MTNLRFAARTSRCGGILHRIHGTSGRFKITMYCCSVFPLNKYGAAIPGELREKLSMPRALSFQHMGTGHYARKARIEVLRKNNRKELYAVRAAHLSAAVKERHTALFSVLMFWSKGGNKFMADCPLNALIDSQKQRMEENPVMLKTATDHYERFSLK